MKNKIHIIFGATASGKTEYAVKLANNIAATGSEPLIINADSMQVFREIPIITNQPTDEERQGIEHEFFGYKSITENTNLQTWLDSVIPLVKSSLDKSRQVLLVGGTGMYLRAVSEGISQIPDVKAEIRHQINYDLANGVISYTQIYDRLEAANRNLNLTFELKLGDSQRLQRAYEVLLSSGKPIGYWHDLGKMEFFSMREYGDDLFEYHVVARERQDIYNRINQRFDKMLDNGLLEEAELADKIFSSYNNESQNKLPLEQLPAYKAHGLREMIAYIKGDIGLEEAKEKAKQATRNYAKRQLTFLRGWKSSIIV